MYPPAKDAAGDINLLQVMQVIQVPVSGWIAHDHLE
jgi:hypothetical protein